MFAVVAVFGDVTFSFNEIIKFFFFHFITIVHGEWLILFIVGILITCFSHMNCMLGFFWIVNFFLNFLLHLRTKAMWFRYVL